VAHFRVTSALQATFHEIQYSSLEPTATSHASCMAGNYRKFFPRTAPKKCRAGQIKTLLRKDGKQRREKHISCQPLLAEDVHIEETRPMPSRMWKLCLRGRA